MTANVLFDLDGVLTTRDSMAALIVQRLKRRPARFLAVLPLFLFAVMSGSHRALTAKANRRIVRLVLRGLSEQEYVALAAETGRLLASQEGFLRDPLVQLCDEASEGSRAVVVTASEHHLARSILDAAGLSHVELLASELIFEGRRPRFRMHNVGRRKIRSVEDAGIEVGGVTFYTDSATDLPLAVMVAEAVLVHPAGRSRRLLRAALPNARIIE